jgi:hypothetical protein
LTPAQASQFKNDVYGNQKLITWMKWGGLAAGILVGVLSFVLFVSAKVKSVKQQSFKYQAING